jgi:hypothetical protein
MEHKAMGLASKSRKNNPQGTILGMCCLSMTGSPIADGIGVTKPGRTLSPIGLSSLLFRNNFAKCVGPVQHVHKVVSQHPALHKASSNSARKQDNKNYLNKNQSTIIQSNIPAASSRHHLAAITLVAICSLSLPPNRNQASDGVKWTDLMESHMSDDKCTCFIMGFT